MRSFTRGRVVAGGGLVTCSLVGVWLTMAGCSGDDTKTDAGPDATADVIPTDVGIDTNKPDVGPADAGSDAYDSAALLAFPGKQLAAFCQRLQGCCFGDAGAGTLAACETQLAGSLEGNLSEVNQFPGLLDAGRLRLNDTAAQSCLAGLATMTCGNSNLVDGGGTSITATEYNSLVQNCYSAIYGTIPLGQEGCTNNIECAPGGFCGAGTGADGGSTTKCLTLEGAGQGPCAIANNTQCEYRGYLGPPALTCEPDGGGASCTAKLANGTNCTYSFECASGLCNQYANDLSQPACAASGPWLDIETCDAVFNTDAGQ